MLSVKLSWIVDTGIVTYVHSHTAWKARGCQKLALSDGARQMSTFNLLNYPNSLVLPSD